MPKFYPFNAIRPMPEKAAAIASPPYDVMSRAEAQAIVQKNPLSFLRVTRSESELSESTDAYSPAVYEKARATYAAFKAAGHLCQDPAPRFYVYALERQTHCQVGIVGCVSVDDYEANLVRRHERTRPEKEDDRTRHVTVLRAQTGPVFLTYRETTDIEAVKAAVTTEQPEVKFTADDGVSHSVWVIPDAMCPALCEAFQDVPVLYIADGHHRAASAARAAEVLSQARRRHGGNEECRRILVVAFPGRDLRILPYNRVVSGLNGHTAEAFIDKLRRDFTVRSADDAKPDTPGSFGMYLDKHWWRLTYRGNLAVLPPLERLDVSLLQNAVLRPHLGITEPRTDRRIDFIGGIRGAAELERRVDSGEADVAFSLYPTTVQQLMHVSDAGLMMPPKSTWFEPKLRDGLFVHEI